MTCREGHAAKRDFAPGNDDAMKHGADSHRRVKPVADELLVELAAIAPWTTSPAFAATASSWAWHEARCRLVREWLDERPLLDNDGNVPPAASYLDRIERRAASLRSQLGLDPMSLGRLLTTMATLAQAGGDADSLEALKEEGRKFRVQVEQRALDAVEAGAG